jgi:D-alanyl-D-alanine carboxypeptidase (penicillin-binding protein 5/6)
VPWSWAVVGLVVVVLIVAAGIYAAVQLLRPAPALAVSASTGVLPRALPGQAPHPDWPAGTQAVVGTPATGIVAAHGGATARPIASLAKIMTAYLVLRDHPLRPGDAGPAITVRPADVATYASERRQGQSVVRVAAGERLSELQALEAMLIPSGNNIAALLAGWDAGSVPKFIARMNDTARSLGLAGTHYADASGASPATVSTAADQFRLTVDALRIPVFRQIVAMPQVQLPVAGLSYNVNAALGHDGIAGVKTGSSLEAGGCLAFSAKRTLAGRAATVVGVVLGVQPTHVQPSELAGVITDAESLLASVGRGFEQVQLARPGAVLAQVRSRWSARTAAVAAAGVQVTGWPGMPVTVKITSRRLGSSIAAGAPVAQATVTVGPEVRHVTLYASGAVRPPTAGWRLTRL